MKKANQKGFTAFEAVLLIIILFLIVGVGYYVVRYNHQTDKAANHTAVTEKTKKPKQATEPKENYVTVRQWGVKIGVGKVADGTYVLTKPNQAFMTTAATQKDSKCIQYYSKDMPSFAEVIRALPSDWPIFNDDPGENAPKTVAAAAAKSPASYTKLGNYYYYAVYGNGMSCGNSDEDALDRTLSHAGRPTVEPAP